MYKVHMRHDDSKKNHFEKLLLKNAAFLFITLLSIQFKFKRMQDFKIFLKFYE